MCFMPYLCNHLGYKHELGLFIYIIIHEESGLPSLDEKNEKKSIWQPYKYNNSGGW